MTSLKNTAMLMIMLLILLVGCANIPTAPTPPLPEQPQGETVLPVSPPLAPAPQNDANAPAETGAPTPEDQETEGKPQTNQTPSPSIEASPTKIKGKSLEERLKKAYDDLHTHGSGEYIRTYFPDIQNVYVDHGEGEGFPSFILPFTYYYSKEADTTFNICNVDFTVFICKGKLDRRINREDIESKRCEVTQIYRQYR
ncbi:hypothetical protein HY488_02260 [Candidatus Woesearchaeota archaeon]|nr:hypothetical protein [Candidatus Woesearchaeota archaeon]